jgi:hypothetical protein
MQSDRPNLRWLVPWHPIDGGTPDDAAARELRREVGGRHVLAGVPARTVGHRQDCDDVLYELLDGSGRLAVVHLTYSNRRERNPTWPETRLLESWGHFERLMRDDHADRDE